MYHHFILLHSDYSQGKRIALHEYDTSIKSLSDFIGIMERLKQDYPHLSFGFHHIQTDKASWKSVQEYDMFFKDVSPVRNINTFTRLITEDDQVSAIDVANLITSKIECTHLKLQKLLFFFYRDYLKNYKTPPFSEKFSAWDYGPVIPELYDIYKVHGRESIESSDMEIRKGEDDITPIIKEELFKLSVYSRFKKTPIYGQILQSLDNTLNEYGYLTASDLVKITHEPGSPWDLVFKDGLGRNEIISSELVISLPN